MGVGGERRKHRPCSADSFHVGLVVFIPVIQNLVEFLLCIITFLWIFFYCVCFQNHVVMVTVRTRCSVFPVSCRGWEAWWMSQCLQIQDTVIHGCRSWIRCTRSGMLPRWKLLHYCVTWAEASRQLALLLFSPPSPQLHSRASQKSVTIIRCVVQPSSAVLFKLIYSLNIAVCWKILLLKFADLRYMYRQGRS